MPIPPETEEAFREFHTLFASVIPGHQRHLLEGWMRGKLVELVQQHATAVVKQTIARATKRMERSYHNGLGRCYYQTALVDLRQEADQLLGLKQV